MTKPTKAKPAPLPLKWSVIRALAVDASCDERTVVKYFRHEDVTPLPRTRIENAIKARGLSAHLVKP